ncbi:hypothetical protein FW774_05120 (plasmid) [Pedobacter sp. BS3]|uniref:transposase n=1 Tax=Pedobacter sp. BS3 TaxID=2567937 RepID=UPI0011EFD326|nr:transposase [Pedobacter sp. BS3]TZF86427.1 hypothetical protein FW774_05120 [Pedobacter sp. BS3]
MSDKFQQKYRIKSARADWWNYGANAAYFVTICTQNRLPYFGKVAEGLVELSDIGKIAHKCWKEIPLHFPFVLLDEFVVMPNHIHGIVVIDKGNAENGGCTTPNLVETQNFASLHRNNQLPINKFGPQSKNLASIIRGFKIGVTKYARTINPNFAWQSRYHDRIIRDQPEHERIASYILNNPINWEGDSLFAG